MFSRAWGRVSKGAQVLAAATFVLVSPHAPAQPSPTAEEVEAAYLHKFLAFVDWPSTAFSAATTPIVVGVAGSERVYELLAGVAAGRPVQGRPVEVRRLGARPDGMPLHMAFVGKDAWSELPRWAAAASGKGVVVVTDAPDATDAGAALAFVREGSRVRFEASLPAADKAGVKLSSRLLNVAARVHGISR